MMDEEKTIKWCIKCKKELAGNTSMNTIFGPIGGEGGLYCQDEDCDRYGLLTVAFLKPQTSAPKDAKPNMPGRPKVTNKRDGI